MTPTELRDCLEDLGWSQRQLGDMLHIGESRARRMARGEAAIPPELASWLRLLAAFHRANRLPVGWRSRPD